MKSTSKIAGVTGLLLFTMGLLGAGQALAVQPVVKTVPWVPSNPLIPHSTWIGKQITLIRYHGCAGCQLPVHLGFR